jgi:aryl-alcohol dehydrogenase-like predicted oxidoreductase
MRYIEVAGERLSVIGLGTWQFGSGDWGYGPDYASRIAPMLVRRALELGVTVVDTAEAYGNGASERIVGAALRDAPGEPFVATKLTPILPVTSWAVRHAANSRERLGVPVIDLYQLHFPNPLVPVGTQGRAMAAVAESGLARHIGVSNHSLSRWKAMERAAGRPILSNQVQLSLAAPGAIRDLVPFATDTGHVVIAYSPLAQGLVASDAVPRPNRARQMRRLLRSPQHGDTEGVRTVLRDIASAHGATMAQVALSWLVSHPNVIAIPGARTLEQLEANVAAAELELAASERDALSEAAFAATA